MTNYSKLVWRCRRGSLELDLLLRQYVDRCYPFASKAQAINFERLLELDDDQLMALLLAEFLNKSS